MQGIMEQFEKYQSSLPPPHIMMAPRESGHEVTRMPSTYKKWTILYPRYFDPTAPSTDRRVPLSQLSYDKKAPSVFHVAQAVVSLGYTVLIESMARHPADPANSGRVRVQWKHDETGIPLVENIKRKRELIKQVAERLPLVPEQDRNMKFEDQQPVKPSTAASETASSSKTAPLPAVTTSSGQVLTARKKGKKGRK